MCVRRWNQSDVKMKLMSKNWTNPTWNSLSENDTTDNFVARLMYLRFFTEQPVEI